MGNEILKAFQVLDKDGNGTISADELRSLVADQNGDGVIDYREFISLGSQTPVHLI